MARKTPERKARKPRNDAKVSRKAEDASSQGSGGSTSDRLIWAAMELFAGQGYKETTVGDIEQAAGLVPRSGALYQHFESKEAVLEAAVEKSIEATAQMEGAYDLLPLGDIRAELTLLARLNLQDLRNRRDFTRVLHAEGHRHPELLAEFRERVIDEPLRKLSQYIASRFEPTGADVDFEALTVVMTQSLVAYVNHERLFGNGPADVDDERFVNAWVDLCMTYAGARGVAS